MSITKYWGVIVSLFGLLVASLIFYTQTVNANVKVQEHDKQIRELQQDTISNTVLLQEIKEQVKRIDGKIDYLVRK
jgi:hypothetical protein